MDAATVGEILRWLIPALVVFGVAALAVLALSLIVRARRRSPRARAAAESARTEAGAALVRLDDAVGELDLDLGLSGALYGGNAPASLRRARMVAQHVRADAFEDFRALSDDTALIPAETQRRAQAVSTHVAEAMAAIARARTDHDRWMAENSSAGAQIDSARTRLDRLREQTGDPDALIRELSARFDESQWADAAAAAAAAKADIAEAQQLLDRAADAADDPSRSALDDLALAERRIRRAQEATLRLEEVHRLVVQAAQALPDELTSMRGAIRQALTTREEVEPDAAARLGEAVRQVEASLTGLEPGSARTPREAIVQIARLRDRLDLALGDARSAQQRLQGARAALPPTIAAARDAVSRAAASIGDAGADARVRLASAQDELATARQVTDPVEALDAARRAMRHAEDAQALADYDRLTRR